MENSPFRQTNREQGRDRVLEDRVRGLEYMMASQIPVDALAGSAATSVQEALEQRTMSRAKLAFIA
jgi:hypothetical protein